MLLKNSTQMWRLFSVRYLHKKDTIIIHNLSFLYSKDAESEITNTEKLQRKYRERKLQPPMDLNIVKELYYLYDRQMKYMEKLRETSNTSHSNVSPTNQCSSNYDNDDDDEEEESQQNYYLTREIERFDRHLMRIKTFVLNLCYVLPNHLHPDTPTGAEDHIISSKVSDNVLGIDHNEVGNKLGVIRYIDNYRYYLMKEAAALELALQDYVSDLLEKREFRSFRNPDTCHEFILKGVHMTDTENECLHLSSDFYRLVGGASLSTFVAYKISGSSHIKFMPERFFSCGRRYVPCHTNIQDGLYSVVQRTNVHAFIASQSEEHMKVEFNDLLSILTSVYDDLELDYRICYKRSSALNISEALRVSIQLYSAHKKEFIDAANISVYDDFLSQRLRLLCHDKDKNSYYAWLLDGVVVSIPIILAHLLERSSDKLLVPSCLLPYMYKK